MRRLAILVACLAVLAAGCSRWAAPIDRMNGLARSADAELAALEVAYAEALDGATTEEERDDVDAVFDAAFAAHRAFVRSWDAARKAVQLAMELEKSDEVDIVSLVMRADELVFDALDAYAEWQTAKAAALAAQ